MKRLGYSTQAANTPREQAPRAQYCVWSVVAASLCSHSTGANPTPLSDHSIYLPLGCWVPLTPHYHTLSLAFYLLAANAQPTCLVSTLPCPSCDTAHAQPYQVITSQCPLYYPAHAQPRCQEIIPKLYYPAHAQPRCQEIKPKFPSCNIVHAQPTLQVVIPQAVTPQYPSHGISHAQPTCQMFTPQCPPCDLVHVPSTHVCPLRDTTHAQPTVGVNKKVTFRLRRTIVRRLDR